MFKALFRDTRQAETTEYERYALACAEHPDVMVVDVLLPDMDGLKAL